MSVSTRVRARETELEIPMAPAAGSGVVREVAAELERRPGIVAKIADALENALVAKRRTWDAGSKQWVEEEDTRCQLQAVFGLFSHFVGDPQKRVIHEIIRARGIDPTDALRESPALMTAAEAMIEKAKFRSTPGKRSTARKVRQEAAIEPAEAQAAEHSAPDAGF